MGNKYMYHKTRAIVLHCIKYSETSVIAKIYTEKLGMQSYMVKGVRAAKSKSKAAMLQPACGQYHFYQEKN